jgi:hypothetical protein
MPQKATAERRRKRLHQNSILVCICVKSFSISMNRNYQLTNFLDFREVCPHRRRRSGGHIPRPGVAPAGDLDRVADRENKQEI